MQKSSMDTNKEKPVSQQIKQSPHLAFFSTLLAFFSKKAEPNENTGLLSNKCSKK